MHLFAPCIVVVLVFAILFRFLFGNHAKAKSQVVIEAYKLFKARLSMCIDMSSHGSAPAPHQRYSLHLT